MFSVTKFNKTSCFWVLFLLFGSFLSLTQAVCAQESPNTQTSETSTPASEPPAPASENKSADETGDSENSENSGNPGTETEIHNGDVSDNFSEDEVQSISDKNHSDPFEQYRILIDLIDSVSRNYVYSYSREELIQAAIEGITSKLDPYSYYIGGENLDRFRRDTNSTFGGVGMALDSVNDKIQVVAPLVGMPAYNAGIYGGDELVEIDGVSVQDKKLDEVIALLSGEIGTSVRLKMVRVGVADPMEFTLTRELITTETIFGFDRNEDNSWNYWLDEKNGIAYLRISEFRDMTATELRKALERLQPSSSQDAETKDSPKLRGLIIDIRFNPGGDFDIAVEMANAFISEGIITTVKGKNVVGQSWHATPEVLIPTEVPVVILTNAYSASASELFSACLQDHERAVIVGERTYGKGIIQSVLPFEGGNSSLKITTAGYFSPNGRNIHRQENAAETDEWGVIPKDGQLVQTTAEEDHQILVDMQIRSALKTHSSIAPDKNPADWRDSQLEKGLEILENALQTNEKASTVLLRRTDSYRKENWSEAAGRLWRGRR